MCDLLRRLFATVFLCAWASGAALAANAIPVIGAIPPLSVAEGATLTYKVSATDADGDPVTITATGLKSWMSFSANTFTATPSSTNSGTYSVTFSASDGKSKSTAIATLTVSNVNQAPTLSALTSKTVAEGGTLTTIISATDPDGDVVTISASGLKTWMTFDGRTLTLTPGYTDSGSYTLIFTASDGKLSASASIAITVTGSNQAPVIATIPALSVAEGSTLTYKVIATDPDGDPVTLTATGLKTWMTFSGGTLTASPGSTHSGSHTVTFTADDGKSKSTSNATLTVGNVNLAPVFNTLSSKTVAEGGTQVTVISATDADGDVVTITAKGLKRWMTFDGRTLTLTPGYSDSGSYSVTFTASDGLLTASAALAVTVNDVNQAPLINPVPTLTVKEGATLSYPISASDPDGDAVTVSASGLKPWMSFSGNTFTATPGYEDAGDYTIGFSATDGIKQVGISFTLTVSAVNRAPVLDTIGNWSVGEGKVLSRPITASDADADTVTLTAQGLQGWMSFDGRNLRVKPGTGNSGTYRLTFSASDGKLTDKETVTVTVNKDGASYPLAWNQHFGAVGSGATWGSWSRNSLFGTTGVSLVWDPSKITELVTTVTDILLTVDVMVPVVGFSVGSPGDYTKLWEFLDLIQDGGTASYQTAVKSQLSALAPLDPTGKRIVYQLGNEVSQYSYSEGVRLWAAGRGISIPGVAAQYDPDYISYYVEYHVAPTVEALLAASLTAYGDANKVTIALGSVDSGGSIGGRAWLDLLLDYQVKGTYAPSLAGKRVNELVDFATVHYVGGTVNLEPTWDKWNGVGTIRGLWTTEEIGHVAAADGRGAGRAIRTVADHLSWYYKKGFNQEQARVALYDWNLNGPVTGTSADTAMLLIHDFFGAVSLEPRKDVVIAELGSGVVETYHLQSLIEDSKRIVALNYGASAATVNSILVDKQGWVGAVDGTLHVFTPAGHTVATVTVTEEGSNYRVNLSQSISLQDDGDAVLITLKLR